jgi:hypothetical protein
MDIVYHHQPIMTGPVNLYNIFLGPDFIRNREQRDTRTLIDFFAKNVGGSDYLQVLSAYYQTVSGITTSASANPVFKQSITTAFNSSDFSIEIAVQTIADLINGGRLPLDQNGIYFVIFSGKLNMLSPVGWFVSICGMHDSFRTSSGEVIKFALIGDPATVPKTGRGDARGDNCAGWVGSATANNNLGGDSIANFYAHELVEAVTGSSGAWSFNSDPPFEMADICGWDFGSTTSNWKTWIGTKKFLLQKLWLPGYGCTLSLP